MKVLVTGGAGYIGSIAVAELINAGHEVVVFDSLYQGHRAAVHPDAAFMQGDLADEAALARIFTEHKHFDGIMHFAAYTLVGESMQNPFKYLRDSFLAGANLFQQAVANDIGRVILSSTANLFEHPVRIPIEPDEAIIPGSPYGELKFFLERTLHWCERIYGLHSISLRYFNAAGGTPARGEAHGPEQHFIPLVLQVPLGQRDHITIFGDDYPTRDGTCVRDYIHVLDLARAHILALEALDRLGSRAYNLGTGTGFTNLEVIETARKITGHPIPHVVGPRRPGDPAVLVASPDKIRDELGWQPRASALDQIVSTAWEWHHTHPNGYGT